MKAVQVTIPVPDGLSPYELERVARSSGATDQMRYFLERAATAIRQNHLRPIVIERVSQNEWRVDGKDVRLLAWMTPVVFWALSEPGTAINIENGRERRYKKCHNGLQAAQDAIARECGEILGRLAARARLRKHGPFGMHVIYEHSVGAPMVIGPSDADDVRAAELPTPPMPRKSRAKPFDPWCDAGR